MPKGNSRAFKVQLLRAHMSKRVADSLGLELQPHSALDAIISATGLTGLESSIELAKMYIEAHAVRMRVTAENKGTEAAIALWNETFPGPEGLDETLCGLIDREASDSVRDALLELYHDYIDAMRLELESDAAPLEEPPEEMKDEERAALTAAGRHA
jgi:hypothetical protein